MLHLCRGAGTFGASSGSGGSGLVLAPSDAQAVLRDGSTHGGVLGGCTASTDLASPRVSGGLPALQLLSRPSGNTLGRGVLPGPISP